MLPVLLSEKIFDVERCARAGVERAYALVDFGTELTQLLDMRQQSLSDLLLIRVGQIRHFRNR